MSVRDPPESWKMNHSQYLFRQRTCWRDPETVQAIQIRRAERKLQPKAATNDYPLRRGFPTISSANKLTMKLIGYMQAFES